MDKYKCTFRCVRQPKAHAGLDGFEPGVVYEGRKYNGMFEISVSWGSGAQTKLIERKLFAEFFEEITINGQSDIENKRDLSICV